MQQNFCVFFDFNRSFDRLTSSFSIIRFFVFLLWYLMSWAISERGTFWNGIWLTGIFSFEILRQRIFCQVTYKLVSDQEIGKKIVKEISLVTGYSSPKQSFEKQMFQIFVTMIKRRYQDPIQYDFGIRSLQWLKTVTTFIFPLK